jgi:hypothetical protein
VGGANFNLTNNGIVHGDTGATNVS